MTTLVLHTKTDRIIYFSEDPLYSPADSEYTWIYNYNSELPSLCTLKNCWDWKLINHRLIYSVTDPKIDPIGSMIDSNKKQLKKLLINKIDLLVENYIPQSKLEQHLYHTKLKAAIEYLNSGVSELLETFAEESEIPITQIANNIIEFENKSIIVLNDYEAKRIKIMHKIDNATTVKIFELIRREIGNLS